MTKFGGLNRTLDITYTTNRLILALATLAGVIAGAQELFQGHVLPEAALAGFFAGASVFFGWAICREIDPNSEKSAFLAAGIGWVFHLSVGGINFLGLLLLVLLLRMLNRVTGLEPSILDLAMPVVIGLWLSISGQGEYMFLAGFAFLLESRLRSSRRWVGLPGIVFIGAGIIQVFSNVQWLASLNLLQSIVLVVMVGIPWWRFIRLYKIATYDDRGIELLAESRVRAAQWFTFAALGVAFLLGAISGLVEIGGGLAAILGAVVYPLAHMGITKALDLFRGVA